MAVEKELIVMRSEERITRKDMAKLIGVTPETYRKKELGEAEWKGSEMFIISGKFGKTIEEIFLSKKSTKSGLNNLIS